MRAMNLHQRFQRLALWIVVRLVGRAGLCRRLRRFLGFPAAAHDRGHLQRCHPSSSEADAGSSSRGGDVGSHGAVCLARPAVRCGAQVGDRYFGFLSEPFRYLAHRFIDAADHLRDWWLPVERVPHRFPAPRVRPGGPGEPDPAPSFAQDNEPHRLLVPSTAVTSSTLSGRPPQPSWRMRSALRRWFLTRAFAVIMATDRSETAPVAAARKRNLPIRSISAN